MGWIDTIRSLLGLQSDDRGGTGDTEITVEREHDATTERAVKEPVESDAESDEPAEADDESGDEGARAEDDSGDEGATEDDAVGGAEEAVEEEDSQVVAEENVDASEEYFSESDDEDRPVVTDIKGIGSAYADRLTEAGVGSVDELAEADAADLSEATGISEKRLQRWIDRAQDR